MKNAMSHKGLRRSASMLLAAILLFTVVFPGAVPTAEALAPPNPIESSSTTVYDLHDGDPYRPAGTIDVALDKSARTNSDQAMSGWSVDNITNGILAYSMETDNNSYYSANGIQDVWVIIDLGKPYPIHSIAMFPHGTSGISAACNPDSYVFDFSVANKDLNELTDGDFSGEVTGTQPYALGRTPTLTTIGGDASTIMARFVRVKMETAAPSYVVLIQEIAVYAVSKIPPVPIDPADTKIYDLNEGDPYAPAGTVDAALGKTAITNSDMATSGWGVANITNGLLVASMDVDNNAYYSNAAVTDPHWVIIDLGEELPIHSIGMFPHATSGISYQCNPEAYAFDFSSADKDIGDLVDGDFSGEVTGTMPYALGRTPTLTEIGGDDSTVLARFVRVKLDPYDAVNLVLISEVAVYALPKVYSAEKEALSALWQEASGKAQASYKSWSWKLLKAAADAAKAVLDDSSATTQDIADAEEALQWELDNLYGQFDVLNLNEVDPFAPAGYFNIALNGTVGYKAPDAALTSQASLENGTDRKSVV